MVRWPLGSLVFGGLLAAASPDAAGAQQLRSLVPPRREQAPEIPPGYRPPRGMCRIWIEGVPADKQPAPTDCATAVKNKPRNGRVVFGEDARDESEPERKDKDKPKKP
jgi:hypothetical protein